jgi:hypothetical protein
VDYFVKAGDMVACRSPQITVEDDKVCSAINTMRLANCLAALQSANRQHRAARSDRRLAELTPRHGTFIPTVGSPLCADTVEKVENQTTQKISQKSISGLLCGCIPCQRHYGEA